MAEPSFLGEGTTQRVKDTRWRLLVKIVGVTYNMVPNPDPNDAPKRTDTRRALIEKWNRLLFGL